jgi:hypothetical protein
MERPAQVFAGFAERRANGFGHRLNERSPFGPQGGRNPAGGTLTFRQYVPYCHDFSIVFNRKLSKENRKKMRIFCKMLSTRDLDIQGLAPRRPNSKCLWLGFLVGNFVAHRREYD